MERRGRPKSDRPKGMAEDLRARFSPGEGPVAVEACLKGLGIELLYEAFEPDLICVAIKHPRRQIVGLNSCLSKENQRFAMGHALGHMTLAHSGQVFVDQSVIRRDPKASCLADAQEIEANAFAMALLMPEDAVRATVRGIWGDNQEASFEAMTCGTAYAFEVSPAVARCRLFNLGYLIPA